MWHLQEALQLIRNIQPNVRKFGYHICLGGSILNKGMSDNDLDLYFIPLEPDSDEPESNRLLLTDYLFTIFGAPEINEDYSDEESVYSLKSIYAYGPNGKRIDAFIV